MQKRDPNAGYYELLDADSYFDCCTWLVDKKGLDLNDEQDSAYIGSNFNPLLSVSNLNHIWHGAYERINPDIVGVSFP